MAIRTVEKTEKEISKLESLIARLKLKLEKIQSGCEHEKTENFGVSRTLKSCARCNKKIAVPPTTSVFPQCPRN